MRRDERRTDPLLPANRHPLRFSSRADPPPRQAPVSPVPVIERLDSIIQIRRREQPPQQLLVFRSSAAHVFPDVYRRPTDISNTPRSLTYVVKANTDLIPSSCCRVTPAGRTAGVADAQRGRLGETCLGCAGAWSPKADPRAANRTAVAHPRSPPRGRRVHSVLVRFSSAFAITSPPRQTLPAGVDAELMPTVPKSVRVRVTGSHRVGGVALGRRCNLGL